MNKRLFFKLTIDFLMFITFLWLILSPITTHYVHELLGVIFVFLLIIHNIMNRKWYIYLLKGKYNLIRILHSTVNLLLISLIVINTISALEISLWIFVFLPFDWGITGRELHIASAYWAMLILSIHIGFHWDMLMNISRKLFRFSLPNFYRKLIMRLFTIIIMAYGIYAIFKLNIGARLMASYSFFFFDTNQSYFIVFIDYLSFCGLCIALAHYSLKLLRYRKSSR